MRSNTLSKKKIEFFNQRIRRYINRAKFKEAYSLSRKLKETYPDVLMFAYLEAVMTAEDHSGYTNAEIKKRYASAARKLRQLLKRMRSANPDLRAAMRNEYYWFSRQPYKQYLLGKSLRRQNLRRSYYSQGVGAAQLAKQYGLKGRRTLCLKWARTSEKSWIKFFELVPKWSNSYFFYAMSLAFQGRLLETEEAIEKMCRISGKSKHWELVTELRCNIREVLSKI